MSNRGKNGIELAMARRARILLAGGLAVGAALLAAGRLEPQAMQVADLNTAGIPSAGFANFDDDAALLNDLFFFSADDGVYGREPWVLDLSTGETTRLGDLSPGPTSSFPEEFVALGSSVLFFATSPASGDELWITDGTPAGTIMVEEIGPGTTGALAAGLTSIPGNRALFRANNGVDGSELWVTNGTAGGTFQVADIYPGATGSTPDYFTVAGSAVYFRAADATAGTELWKLTVGGLTRVLDIEPGVDGAYPSSIYAVGNAIVFSACTTADGCEPWTSDGSAAGTVQVADIHPTDDSYPYNFLWHAGLARLFFVADDGTHGAELWQLQAGVASRLSDIQAGAADSDPDGFGALPTELVFTADDGGSGTRLFKFDGVGVSQIKSLSTAGAPNFVRHALSWNSEVYFYEINSGCWRTDGTVAGTVEWNDDCLDSPRHLVGDGRLIHGSYVSGERELWSVDAAGAIAQETDLASYSSSPADFTWLGELAFFSADDGIAGRELWVTDGTSGGSERIDLSAGAGGSFPAGFVAFDNEIWFYATTSATGDDLWHRDGTPAGTLPYELAPGSSGSYPSELVVLGEHLFVAASDPALGYQLFRISGAASPPEILDVGGEDDLDPYGLVPAGSQLYFFGYTAATGYELFVVDEVAAAPTALEVVPGASDPDDLDELVSWNGAAWFVADDGIFGTEIWRSQGANVARVTSLTSSSPPEKLTAGPGGVYFTYDEPVLGNELWRTNGTTTAAITDIAPLDDDSYPEELTRAGNRLYFVATDDTSGRELWWTDGSTVTQVADLRPGDAGSSPSGLIAAGNQLIFSADDGLSGRELWAADESTARLLPEAWTGVAASNPLEVAVHPAAHRILFSAFDPAAAREPFRIDLMPFADGFESGTALAWSSTSP